LKTAATGSNLVFVTVTCRTTECPGRRQTRCRFVFFSVFGEIGLWPTGKLGEKVSPAESVRRRRDAIGSTLAACTPARE